ncbi:GNAT family N-acetyltransferase [Ramlibacter montanisoli]|uniref:GNAT family N-acetyltransferase n=1 Tax=Ramlibacter montanisoli TaxID=2732512 RepID=A0A849KP61_9BURK|nr:GNAT family N-acetyltransferase [Ramlibacter montanisoli]NNU43579.1 GNAT family N-acetyltransferase [Ramlibacter montanisoli]
MQFDLNLDLVWVLPALRGQGYGLHLVAHLVRYFDTNQVPESHFGNTLEGIKVRITRPPASGCVWTAKKLADSFDQHRCLAQMGQTSARPPVSWPVLEVSVHDDD